MSLPCQASVMPSRGTALTCNDAPQITNYNCRKGAGISHEEKNVVQLACN